MTVFGGDPILAADMNRALTRVIAATEATSDLSAINSATNTLIDSVTAAVEAGRRYKISAYIPVILSDTASNHYILICEDSVSGAQLTYDTARHAQTARPQAYVLWVYWTATTTGNKTFVSCTRRADGTGTITPKGATSQKRNLAVEAAD